MEPQAGAAAVPARTPRFGAFAAPRLPEAVVLALVAVALAAYLPIVLRRTVTLGFGDVQVFFRAGWAIWSGFPLYEVADHHGWTYHYPPTFALFMGPFADAPPGHLPLRWALPYPVSVALWYVICAVALVLSLHVWATALERHAGLDPAPGYWHPWWILRLSPLLALLPFAGDGLGRGQPTAIVLLAMVGFLAAYARQRRGAAAFALSIGITLKMFPLGLALFPLVRRDWRMLGLIAGYSALLLFALPAAVLGPRATMALYEALWSERIAGILSGSPSKHVAAQISFLSYDMGSIAAMLTRIVHGGVPGTDLPLPAWATLAQLGANLAIVAALLVAGHRRLWRLIGPQPSDPYALLLGGAILMAALPAMLPVSQPNYWALAMPLEAAMLVETWGRRGRVGVPATLVAWAALAWFAMIATEVTIWHPLRVIGLATPVMLALAAAGLVALAQRRPAGPGSGPGALGAPGPAGNPDAALARR